MVKEIPSDAYRAAGFDLGRGVDPEVADDIGHPVPKHLLGEDEQGEHSGYQLEDPELDAAWQERHSRELSVAPEMGGLTIAEAQRNAARHAVRHKEIRGQERRAANRPTAEDEK